MRNLKEEAEMRQRELREAYEIHSAHARQVIDKFRSLALNEVEPIFKEISPTVYVAQYTLDDEYGPEQCTEVFCSEDMAHEYVLRMRDECGAKNIQVLPREVQYTNEK